MYSYIHDLKAFDGATDFLLILQPFFIYFLAKKQCHVSNVAYNVAHQVYIH